MTGLWFLLLLLLMAAGFALGVRVGRGRPRLAWMTLLTAIGMIGGWAWLLRHPDVAVHVIPVGVLSYVEGAGAVPMFMVVLGVAWAQARNAHQRRLTVFAGFFGGVFFMQGSMWMLQSTPTPVMGDGRGDGGIVMQSQDFTCVPAACATALKRLGVHTTEAEMAGLTHTRPGTGATLLRAMNGLNLKLTGSPWRVELVEADVSKLTVLPTPMLTPLALEPQKLHMVVIMRVSRDTVTIADPQVGFHHMSWRQFQRVYTGRVLVFQER